MINIIISYNFGFTLTWGPLVMLPGTETIPTQTSAHYWHSDKSK